MKTTVVQSYLDHDIRHRNPVKLDLTVSPWEITGTPVDLLDDMFVLDTGSYYFLGFISEVKHYRLA